MISLSLESCILKGTAQEYLELMVAFALICLFGTVLPSMSVLLFIANLIEVRLLAYRYLKSTGRPYPSGAEDIGAWDYCFDLVTQASLVVMPLLFVLEMHPLRDMGKAIEWETFLIIEHGCILVKMILMSFYTRDPFDVRKSIIYAEEKNAELFSSSKRGNIDLLARDADYKYRPAIEAFGDAPATGVLYTALSKS